MNTTRRSLTDSTACQGTKSGGLRNLKGKEIDRCNPTELTVTNKQLLYETGKKRRPNDPDAKRKRSPSISPCVRNCTARLAHPPKWANASVIMNHTASKNGISHSRLSKVGTGSECMVPAL